MSPQDDDFNWVKAFAECSLNKEFQELKRVASYHVRERKKHLSPESPTRFHFHEFENDRGYFEIDRSAKGGRTKTEVLFSLRENHILVEKNADETEYILTLTLNDEGECRYQIDGKGEFKRWQVLRRALQYLFFGTNN